MVQSFRNRIPDLRTQFSAIFNVLPTHRAISVLRLLNRLTPASRLLALEIKQLLHARIVKIHILQPLQINFFYDVTVSSRFMNFAVPLNDLNGVHFEEYRALVDSLVLDNFI
jgi:hypothetical protein